MLGVPGSPGSVGWTLLTAGALLVVVACALLRARLQVAAPTAAAAGICLIVTAAALPYVAWRFVEDLRVTTALHGYDRAAAGPVQAYLPGYLIDGARRRIPTGATFATVVGPDVPFAAGRAAFPSLALETLFPRISVSDLRSADYVVTWGIRPNRVTPVSRVWVVRRRAGAYPAVYVGRIER